MPGPGKSQLTVTVRPDDDSLLAKKQLQEKVGVSNPNVITKVIERLGIEPVTNGSKSLLTYNNGGRGARYFDVAYFPASVVDLIRTELQRNAVPCANGKLSYGGVTFRWSSPR